MTSPRMKADTRLAVQYKDGEVRGNRGRSQRGRMALRAFSAKLSDADPSSRTLRAFRLIKGQRGCAQLTEVRGSDGPEGDIEEYFKGARSKIAAALAGRDGSQLASWVTMASPDPVGQVRSPKTQCE